MTDDPLMQLICDALGLMNRAFVDLQEPASVEREFYHQFRKLWDRGIPVGMGLGHLVVRGGPLGLDVVRLGENGKADESLTTIGFAPARSSSHVAAFPARVLAEAKERTSYPFPLILIFFGTTLDLASEPGSPTGLAVIRFDTKRWTASITGT
jgi:hypothetical protein